MANKEVESIDGQILQGIYDELLTLHRQVGEMAMLLHKKNIITKEEAWPLINMRPRQEDNT